MPTPASTIPTESFFVANDRIMAAICGGQLVTDHVMGVSAFHAPAKDSPTLVQSTRLLLSVDGVFAEAYDADDGGAIVERGFVEGSRAVRIRWHREGLEVEDTYFIPPGIDAVVQRSRITNAGDRSRNVKAFGILYPQLGSPVPHKKGICEEARYDAETGCIAISDTRGNVLGFGFDRLPGEFQVGEVCGGTDVYYDLEDHALSGHAVVHRVTPNAALALSAQTLGPGASMDFALVLSHGGDPDAAIDAITRYRQDPEVHWLAHDAFCRVTLAKAEPSLPRNLDPFGRQLDEVIRRSVLVLRSILRPDGAPMGGIHCYQNVGQVRNGTYILNVLDQLGFHEETRGGYEFYLNFRVGDDRYSSPDENDQLGTVLHVLRRRLDLCGDMELVERHADKILGLADRLIGLMDRRLGLIYSERAIHEFVSISRGYESYVNTMAWRGLADATVLAQRLNRSAPADRYAEAADGLRARIIQHLVDPERGVFVKRLYRGKHYPLPSISMITPALFGVIDARDPIVTRTIDHMKASNWDKSIGGLYRYPLHLQPWPEHPFGGPWVTYTSWLGGVHMLRDEIDQAAACIRWVLDQLPSDSNLVAEHFSIHHVGRRGFARIYLDPATPEVWATAEFLRLVMRYASAVAPSVGPG